jgi:dihydroorotase-like cyclic amidohydrolase
LPEQQDTWIEIDPQAEWEISSQDLQTRCHWTPFEGWKVRGRIRRVVLRSKEVYKDGQILAPPGSGRNVRLREPEYGA